MEQVVEKAKKQMDAICGQFEGALRGKDIQIENVKREKGFYMDALEQTLRSKIGQKIYWAHKDWLKYEEHTISDVRREIQESDFFGQEYKGKMVIKIFLADGGHYIANDIGNTLFFTVKDASAHTYQAMV